MINGSPIAPFRHDSTWPNEILRRFRSAVYYLHVHVPSLDPVMHLRELVLHKERRDRPVQLSPQWEHVKIACNKLAHVAVSGVRDAERFNLVKNLLIFANLLLIEDYGLVSHGELRLQADDPEKEAQHQADRKAARLRFIEYIDQAYDSLKAAIAALKQPGGHLRGSLNLEKATVTSAIPCPITSLKAEDTSFNMILTFTARNSDACEYEFRAREPIGWVMMSGKPSKDVFANDATASGGIFGSRE